jgi:hypothetical protein
MTITAKIIADSIGAKTTRLTTMQLRYPRFIHAELMTHRVFSRNASSSRAIPVSRLIEDVIQDTAMPIHWGKNQPGMQAREEHDAPVMVGEFFPHEALVKADAKGAWLHARDKAIKMAEAFHAAGYHKQVVNRLLEPFSHINVVVTATNFDNFYWLRRHPDAQPEIKVLADAMYEAQQASDPEFLDEGEWHLPYITEQDRDMSFPVLLQDNNVDYDPVTVEDLISVSVARCARVSYLTHDGKAPNFEDDFALYCKLVGSSPLHTSPAEHQATPDNPIYGPHGEEIWENPHLSGNLDQGWIQFRKTLDGEFCKKYQGA